MDSDKRIRLLKVVAYCSMPCCPVRGIPARLDLNASRKSGVFPTESPQFGFLCPTSHSFFQVV